MEHTTKTGRKLEFYPAGASEWLIIEPTAAYAGYAWAYGDQFAIETRTRDIEYAPTFAAALERI